MRQVKPRAAASTRNREEGAVNRAAQDLSALRADLLAYCRRFSLSRCEAEDIVQDTLVKALPVIDGTRRHANTRALLRRIAKNTWLDGLRAGRSDLRLGDEGPAVDMVARGPEDGLAVLEGLDLVIRALTPIQRKAFLLCDVFAYTDREAAAEIGCTQGAVKAALHRARARLHAWRERDGREEGHEADGRGDSPTAGQRDRQPHGGKKHGRGFEGWEGECAETVEDVLGAYADAFHAADMAALLRLCQYGVRSAAPAVPYVLGAPQSRERAARKATGPATLCMVA